jgi:hypothetical protein
MENSNEQGMNDEKTLETNHKETMAKLKKEYDDFSKKLTASLSANMT